MSDNDKSTCPVCFTKMRNINKVPTCPECGYKYCDHNRDLQNMFDTSHTHTANYTTYTNNSTSYQNTSTQASAPNKNFANTYSSSGKTTYTNTSSGRTTYNNTSGQKTSKKSAAKIIKIIVIIYILLMFCPIGCGALFTAIGVIGEMADSDSSPEIHISSDLVDEDYSTDEDIAVDTLLAEMDADASIELEVDDGEFVPELIKHIFDVDSTDDVTNKDMSTLYYLDISRYAEDSIHAYYYTSDGDYGDFEFEGSEFNPKDLGAFWALEYLYTPSETYKAGDLQNLKLLNTLSCKNTPAELLDVMDVSQLSDLTLELPEGTSSLDGLEQFSSLCFLEISGYTANITDAHQIAELPNLYYLVYSDSGALTDYSFLSQMPDMEYLYLYSPGLSDLSFIGDMPNLYSFSLWASTDVSDISPLTEAADTLDSLDLSYNFGITDFTPISELTALEYLTLDACSLSDLSFASDLENLVTLSISETQVTSLEPIKDLPNLENLYTYDTPIEDYAGLEDIAFGY